MDKPTDLVSIMMPAYNASQFIRHAIQSVIEQTYPIWELIIVNDGSNDNTAEIIAEFEDSRIRTYHQTNQGEASARNVALQHMQGEWIAFLDADDQFLPDFLEIMIEFLANHSHLSAAYCDGWYIDTEGIRLEALSTQRRGPFEADLYEELVRASDVFGPPTCTLIRRSVVMDSQLTFDPQIVIGPDWDFFTRLAQFTSWGFADFKGVNYRVHQTNITTRVGTEKRRDSLAICRKKAIQLAGFKNFSTATRFYVYYDLLVNLIFDQPERIQLFLNDKNFQDLPRAFQARLLRLMAAKSMTVDPAGFYIKSWLRQSRVLNPFDLKTWFLSMGAGICPNLAQKLLKKRFQAVQSPNTTPFKLEN